MLRVVRPVSVRRLSTFAKFRAWRSRRTQNERRVYINQWEFPTLAQSFKYAFYIGLLATFGPSISVEFVEDEQEEEEDGSHEKDKDEHKPKEAAPTKDDEENRETVLPGSVAVTQQRSIFMPLTWARPREIPVDDEFNEKFMKVIELAQDPKMIVGLKRYLAQAAFESIGSQRPAIIRPLGPPVVWREQYWFTVTFPEYPPTQYEHSGLELTRNAIYWTTRAMTPYDRARFEQASWPVAMARSFGAGFYAAGLANLDRLKMYLGRDPRSTTGETFEKVPPEPPSKSPQQPTSVAGEKPRGNSRADPTRNTDAPRHDQPSSDHSPEHAPQQGAWSQRPGRGTSSKPVADSPKTPRPAAEASSSGTSADASPDTSTPKPASSGSDAGVRKPGLSPPDAVVVDTRSQRTPFLRAFLQAWHQNWSYVDVPPSHTAVKFEGHILIRGHKGTVLAQVTTYYDPVATAKPLSSMTIKIIDRQLYDLGP
ncbi:MAG: hypothetical protein M1823_001988 [Watsoniomyces obsoletus]|nr:MAG: hypothetical protein M1823_001988 [Watsoniomyces obsoletus]